MDTDAMWKTVKQIENSRRQAIWARTKTLVSTIFFVTVTLVLVRVSKAGPTGGDHSYDLVAMLLGYLPVLLGIVAVFVFSLLFNWLNVRYVQGLEKKREQYARDGNWLRMLPLKKRMRNYVFKLQLYETAVAFMERDPDLEVMVRSYLNVRHQQSDRFFSVFYACLAVAIAAWLGPK